MISPELRPPIIAGSAIAATFSIMFGIHLPHTVEKIADANTQYAVSAVALELEKQIAIAENDISDKKISESALAPLLPGMVDGIINNKPLRASTDDEIALTISGTFGDYCVTGTNPNGEESVKGYSLDFGNDKTILTDETNSANCQTSTGDIVYGTPVPEGTVYEENNYVLPIGGASLFGAIALYSTIRLISGRRKESDEEISNVKPKAVTAKVVPEKPKRVRNAQDEWDNLIQRHENVLREWASYELDLTKILSYPSLANMGLPATNEFHKNLRMSKHLLPTKKMRITASGSSFEKSVLALEHSFEVMVSEAKRMKWNSFSAKEQNSLRKAQNLLSVAMNSSSSENERHIAYKQLIKELEGIVSLPNTTVLALEASIPKAIESGASNPTLTSEDVMRLISTPEKEKSGVIR